jgi:hypothetical protein
MLLTHAQVHNVGGQNIHSQADNQSLIYAAALLDLTRIYLKFHWAIQTSLTWPGEHEVDARSVLFVASDNTMAYDCATENQARHQRILED